MTIYDLVSLFIATAGVSLAVIAQLRISKNEQEYQSDKSETKRRLNALADYQDSEADLWRSEIDVLKSPCIVEKQQTETATREQDEHTRLCEALFVNAIHCQQSVRNWMHDCDWSKYVSNGAIKEQLSEVMRLIEKHKGDWKNFYTLSAYTPEWLVKAFEAPAPKDPDQNVKAIMERLHNIYKTQVDRNAEGLKPFPTSYSR